MSRLTYSLAALLLGVAASTSGFASPQDAKASAASTGQVLSRDTIDPSGRMLKMGYSTAMPSDAANMAAAGVSSYGTAAAGKPDGIVKFLEDLPQSKGFTLLAAVGVIFVIARRRLSAQKY